MVRNARYAVVTPYYREERSLLERCIRSVQAQSLAADHFMVADGYPQDWLDHEPGVRHIRLDRSHGDFGNTPRGIGALLAAGEGYDGIALLDADNWLEPNHVELCAEASRRSETCDYVIARRHLRRPDGSIIQTPDASISRHVDTSCFFLLPGSYFLLARFPLYPPKIAQMCDQIFYLALRENRLKPEVVAEKTVNYHCLWPIIYRMAGETPPPEADHNFDLPGIAAWFASRSRRELDIAYRNMGCKLHLRMPRRVPSSAAGARPETPALRTAPAPVPQRAPELAKRYAIVTPYRKEDRALLERCIASVRAQTVATDHFLVADGAPQAWIDREPVRHIRLDRDHANFGNTPRAVGAVLAASEGYDGIGLLEAESWLDDDHVAACIDAARRTAHCDYVLARRRIRSTDGSILDGEDEPGEPAGTSRFFLLPGSYHAIPHFGLMPGELAPVCDRVFGTALSGHGLHAETVQRTTVNSHRLRPPSDREETERGVDGERISRWLAGRSTRERELIQRLAGCGIAF